MKVALLFIGLNSRYWPFLKAINEDVDKNFLRGHQVDRFCWTDIPEIDSKEFAAVLNGHNKADAITARIKELQDLKAQATTPEAQQTLAMEILATQKLDTWESIDETVRYIRGRKDITLFPTGPTEWPLPTLMRYHLFLQQEDILKNYDYIFYLDADMRMVGVVGEEILGDGLTMAQHPMYALARRYIPPYEPNPNSTAYIPRFGRIQAVDGIPYFEPLYAAGGFQGGKSADFIKAMWSMKRNIDKDFNNNYTAIWNDESHWNYYLSQRPPAVVLDPGYIYPDSLINEYYIPTWGRNYEPKIITLTKKFSLSPLGMDGLRKLVGAPPTTSPFICPTCGCSIVDPKLRVIRVVSCGGPGKAHQVEGEML